MRVAISGSGTCLMQHRKIGIAGPFSGPRREYGALLEAAARSALAERSAETRDRGSSIVIADDAADPAMACKAAETLISEGCRVVVGHFNSDAARAAAPLYREAGIALLLPAATGDNLAAQVGAFRLCAPDQAQVRALAGACTGRRIALMHDDTAYAGRLVRALSEEIGGCGRQTVAIPLDPCMAVPDSDEAILLGTHVAIRAALRHWYAGSIGGAQAHPRFFACDDCSIPAFMEGIPPALAVTIASPLPDFAAATREGVRLAVDAMRAAPGREIGFLRDSGLFDEAGESISAGFVLTTGHGPETGSDRLEGTGA